MFVFEKKSQLGSHFKAIYGSGKKIGFVPTMGALHSGHLSLLARSLAENDFSVISIFVNPTQFNNADDLKKYPRTLESDIEKLKTLSPEIIVYAPAVEDIYEGNTVSGHFDFDGLEDQMEGKQRPGHFDGVGTVVKKLFEIVRPDVAYFGEKDFQQLQIVRKLVEKYNLPVKITGMPVFREESGLAMSSRNERLSVEAREKSAVIFAVMTQAKSDFSTENPETVMQNVRKRFEEIPGMDLEYFEIADESTLQPIENKIPNRKYRAFIAVFVEGVRLIDTVSLN